MVQLSNFMCVQCGLNYVCVLVFELRVCALLGICMCACVSCEFVLYGVSACVLVLKFHEFVLYCVRVWVTY